MNNASDASINVCLMSQPCRKCHGVSHLSRILLHTERVVKRMNVVAASNLPLSMHLRIILTVCQLPLALDPLYTYSHDTDDNEISSITPFYVHGISCAPTTGLASSSKHP